VRGPTDTFLCFFLLFFLGGEGLEFWGACRVVLMTDNPLRTETYM